MNTGTDTDTDTDTDTCICICTHKSNRTPNSTAQSRASYRIVSHRILALFVLLLSSNTFNVFNLSCSSIKTIPSGIPLLRTRSISTLQINNKNQIKIKQKQSNSIIQ
jgi:hypothetical protein